MSEGVRYARPRGSMRPVVYEPKIVNDDYTTSIHLMNMVKDLNLGVKGFFRHRLPSNVHLLAFSSLIGWQRYCIVNN
jgi:hypothetical protein